MPSTVTVISREQRTPNMLNIMCNIPSIAAGGNSPEYQLPTDPFDLLSLENFYVLCASTTYTVSLSDVSGTTNPSVDELLRVEAIDLSYNENGLGVIFDAASFYIYFQLANTDVGNNTGVVTITYTLNR